MSDGGINTHHRLPMATGAREWPPHRSVFAKLVVIMVTMALCLLVVVGAFFWFVIGPDLHSSIDRVWEEYTRGLAARSLDLATAQQLGAQLDLEVRYEGPAGRWTTARGLPSVDAVQQGRVRLHSLWRNYFVARAPDGGTYLFAWRLTNRAHELHSALVTLLLFVMGAILITAYFVLQRLLAPLRGLNEGVARLSAGQLDVELRTATRDEFGRLTDAFNQMVRRVRGMIDARDQLLLDVSHELRSPLTRMKVALELLPDDAQRAGMAADILEMERMIAELLEMERLRSGRGLRLSRQDLVPLLAEMAARYGERPPGVRFVPPPGALEAAMDADKIRTVLRNLLENAAKYSLPESRPVEIAASRDGDRILVRVSDDGPGIPDSDLDRVFEPFYRADRSRSKNTGGYGLGLSICKRVMQAHGGDIVLERGGGGGTTFVLTLPVFAAAHSDR